MGASYRKLSQRSYSTAEAAELLQALAARIPGWKPIRGSRRVEATLHSTEIPDPAELPSFELGHFSVTGFLGKPGRDDLARFLVVLERGAATLGTLGQLQVTMGFEERSSRQSARSCDSVSVGFRRGAPFFTYSSNGSRFTRDQAYARQVLERIVPALDLPLRVRVEGAAHYFLEHADGGELFVSRTGLGGASPGTFRCEWQVAPARLVGAMERFLVECASEKRFAPEWRVAGLPDGNERVPEGPAPLSSLRAAGLPAKKVELQATLFLGDDVALAPLEVLRRLSAPGDESSTPIATVDGEPPLDVLLQTSSAGHRVVLDAGRFELDEAPWARALGVRLVDASR